MRNTVNYIDLSSICTSNNSGIFGDKIETIFNCESKTKSLIDSLDLFESEKRMDNNKFLEELRSLMRSRFGNDINKLAKCVGKPATDIQAFIDGTLDFPSGFLEDFVDCMSKEGDRVQFGDKYIEINNSGDNMTNNYAGIMKGSQTNIIKMLKSENKELKRINKEQEELILILKNQINEMRK